MKKVLIINSPNINMLEIREHEIYGPTLLAMLKSKLKALLKI
ncbi:MAG: type II 3-dehydroquinate dehydratase [Endomicrobium sp.]|jgi:3-dehydroquinate dehydratase|nr:type II 3-dehydroquinate dehydratase [Endomicrobium sp.]